MVKNLRSLGFLDAEAYPTVKDFVESLPHLYIRTDLMFVMDSRVFNFLAEGWAKEGNFDFSSVSIIYEKILAKLATAGSAAVPSQQTKYRRDAVSVVAEWA